MGEGERSRTRIIGLVGFSGSGKGTVATLIKQEYGFPCISTGDVVRKRALQLYHDVNPETTAAASDDIRRETAGRFILAVADDLTLLFQQSETVLLDCLREPSDVEVARSLAGTLVILAVRVSDTVRRERLLRRDRPGNPKTPGEVLELDAKEHRLGVDVVMERADVEIKNDGTLEDLRDEVKRVMGPLLLL